MAFFRQPPLLFRHLPCSGKFGKKERGSGEKERRSGEKEGGSGEKVDFVAKNAISVAKKKPLV
jgi:hypothetical protein